MPIESAEFRRVLGHFATGVTVVAARADDGSPRGLTASSVTSVSLDPPLVLVCVERTSETHDIIAGSGAFAASILADDQERLARRFAAYDPEERFEDVAVMEGSTGSPIVDGALAWVDCSLWATYDGGDHSIFVGEVLGADARSGEPLLYFRGGFGGGA